MWAGLVTGLEELSASGIALSPLLWCSDRVAIRHLGLVVAFLAHSLASQHFGFVDDVLARVELRFLPTAVALGFLIRPSAIAVLAVAATGRRRMIVGVTANVAAVLFGIAMVQVLSFRQSDLETTGYALLTLAAATEVFNTWVLWTEQEEIAGPARLQQVALLFASLAIATQSLQRVPIGSDVDIWWPDNGRPEFASIGEAYGWGNVGHFGELPLLLERSGYRVTRLPDLEGASASVIILPVPVRALRPGEVERLRQKLVDGARVLLIAEHTNLDGVRDSYNAVLAGTGVQLNFDTTNGLFGDGTMALSGPHVRANPYLTHNRGASLSVTSLAPTILLKGSWWHSDFGDALAPERGYLSDYRLSARDRVGNVVLAARAPLGDGEVTVWGDGSPFLNQNTAHSSRYVLDVMRMVGGHPRLAWVAPVGALIFVVLWVFSRRVEIVGLAVLVAAVGPLMPVGHSPLLQPLAIISDRENNGFDRDPFSDRGVTGLAMSARRVGLFPWIGTWNASADRPAVLFIINPQRTITPRYVSDVRRAAEAGTTVILTGGGDSPTFRKLAASFGADPVGEPVGSVQGSQFTTYSAWQLKSMAGMPLMVGDVQVGTAMDVGAGRVVVIADSGFMFSKNLETESRYDVRNLTFIQSLISHR